jgi:hypothetical protein
MERLSDGIPATASERSIRQGMLPERAVDVEAAKSRVWHRIRSEIMASGAQPQRCPRCQLERQS